ncbi:GNAT family N-acetyltransferase [Paenibacillus bovis]|uniref:GNAT family acetyltransferase n=1 Tax=Paenibacillus bovis TaxID=1616788 RepID=A0A172ZKQ0_9BACL|nr:GNAT family N-acetyltransferase [Paenibacillus bovis]ANF97720.1 GNAT family acetyltransferase [Paenibacillus bovis]
MITQHAFNQVFDIMAQSFPVTEYRTYEEQQKLLADPRYRLLTETNEQGDIIAFLAGWELETVRYVENIAVSPHIRGGGIGKRLMERFLSLSGMPVVLEVEPPEDELQQRRIGFYERLGFHLEDYMYMQPPLRTGQSGMLLCIMSYPQPLTQERFHSIRQELYRHVYRMPVHNH